MPQIILVHTIIDCSLLAPNSCVIASRLKKLVVGWLLLPKLDYKTTTNVDGDLKRKTHKRISDQLDTDLTMDHLGA